MQVGEGEFFGDVIGLKNSGIANHRHRTFAGQAAPFTVKEPHCGLVCPKAKVLISQCSSRTSSFMRIMSVAIIASPMSENRPWMMTKSPSATIIPGSYLNQVEETVTARLNVCTVLNVVGRPEALSCRIISLIEQGLEGFQHNRLIALCF